MSSTSARARASRSASQHIDPKRTVESAAYSVAEFCRAHGFSRALWYTLPTEDRPQTFSIGRRVLISKEAAAAWRARLERRAARKAA